MQVDHERAARLHRRKARIHAVSQATLLAHFAHQAGAEAAATENLVTHGQCRVVRVIAIDAQLREHQVGLLGRELDMADAGLGLSGLRNFRQGRAFGQGAGNLGGNRFGFRAGQVADQCDHHVTGCVGFLVESTQLGLGNRRYGFRRAVAGVCIRVITVQAVHQLQARQFAGVLFLVFETGKHLVLDAGQRIGRESRLADDFGEQLQGRLALVLGTQATQRSDCHVLKSAVAEIGAQAFEALGNGADVFAGHAFVEHGVGQHRHARCIAVLAATGSEDQAHVEHRQLMGFDKQHLGAFGGVPGLHVQLAVVRCLAVEFGQRLQFLTGLGLVEGFAGIGFDRARQIERCGTDNGDGDQADQGQAGGFTLTHESSPEAVHGRR
ncbi:hypothetical protein D3C72_698270 [compost metagenome]